MLILKIDGHGVNLLGLGFLTNILF
jgi:hypothetical protein